MRKVRAGACRPQVKTHLHRRLQLHLDPRCSRHFAHRTPVHCNGVNTHLSEMNMKPATLQVMGSRLPAAGGVVILNT